MLRLIEKTNPILNAVAFALGILVSNTVWAQEPRVPDCVESFENGQTLRKAGKLLAASEALIACSQPSCPAFIAKECTELYTQTQNSLPSITVGAVDSQGNALTDISVYLDGKLLTEHPDGRAVQVDPGVHELKFMPQGKPAVIMKALVTEGEKNKLVSTVIQSPEAKSTRKPEPITEPPQSSATPTERHSSPPIAAYIVGGLGVLAVGTGVTLRLLASHDYDQLSNTCHSSCSDSDVNSLSRKYTVSSIVLAGGGAALVTAGVLYLIHGSSKSQPRTGLVLAPTPVGAGAWASWRGSF
jgi:hypothetical protein